MTRQQIDKGFKKLNFELFETKPRCNGPFPLKIVRKRELLLFAEVALNKILEAKKNKNYFDEKQYEKFYKFALSKHYARTSNKK